LSDSTGPRLSSSEHGCEVNLVFAGSSKRRCSAAGSIALGELVGWRQEPSWWGNYFGAPTHHNYRSQPHANRSTPGSLHKDLRFACTKCAARRTCPWCSEALPGLFVVVRRQRAELAVGQSRAHAVAGRRGSWHETRSRERGEEIEQGAAVHAESIHRHDAQTETGSEVADFSEIAPKIWRRHGARSAIGW
jgi:hypothetical protein